MSTQVVAVTSDGRALERDTSDDTFVIGGRTVENGAVLRMERSDELRWTDVDSKLWAYKVLGLPTAPPAGANGDVPPAAPRVVSDEVPRATGLLGASEDAPAAVPPTVDQGQAGNVPAVHAGEEPLSRSNAFVPSDPAAVKVGGWLMLFCITLVLVNPIQLLGGLLSTDLRDAAVVFDEFPLLAVMSVVEFVGDVLLAMFSIYAGVRLLGRKRNAVRTAKLFLIVGCTYVLVSFALTVAAVPQSMRAEVVSDLSRGLGQPLGYAGIWFIYLSRSERVKLTFPSGG